MVSLSNHHSSTLNGWFDFVTLRSPCPVLDLFEHLRNDKFLLINETLLINLFYHINYIPSMKIQTLDQSLKCATCKVQHLVKTCRKLMNFTAGEITFFCRNCRTKIGFLNFGRWNSLHHLYLKKLEEKVSGEVSRNRDPRRREFRR